MKLIIVFFVASAIFFIVGIFQCRNEKRKSVVSATRFSYTFLWQAFDNWGDFVLYPFVVGALGPLNGFITMFFITLVLNAVYVVVNNNTEEDWTFMGTFNHLRESNSVVWFLPYARFLKASRLWGIRRFYCCLLKKLRNLLQKRFLGIYISKPLGFLFFSIKFDSFCAISFLYHKKVNLGNWKVLSLYLLSHVICNGAWVPVALGISSITKWIFNINL